MTASTQIFRDSEADRRHRAHARRRRAALGLGRHADRAGQRAGACDSHRPAQRDRPHRYLAEHRGERAFAAAQADYAQLLGTLFAAGHYSATIRILIDGREAVTFLKTIKEAIEDPTRLLIDL